jgi:molybdate transport system regulatory protein
MVGQFDAMPRLSIRIYFEPHGGYLGPGMAQLLDGIQQFGSIRRAAAAMGMGYRKAWLLVQQMQDTFAGPVVTTATGGAAGGGAVLTERGQSLLSNYRAIESHSAQAAASELQILSAMAAAGSRKRSRADPKRKATRRRRDPTPAAK